MKIDSTMSNRNQVKKAISIYVCRLFPRSILLFVLRSAFRVDFGSTWKKIVGLILLTQDPNYLRRLNITLPEKNKIVDSADGYRYFCDVNDHIGYMLFVKGYFDLLPGQVFNSLAAHLNPLIYIDIGANIGTTMIPIASKLPSIGIEMNDSTFYRLALNNSLNNSESFLVKAALGQCPLIEGARSNPHLASYFVNHGNTGSTSLIKGYNKSGTQDERRAILSSIDLIVNSVFDISSATSDRPIFVKIDVEGFEYEVLRNSFLIKSNVIGLFEHRPDLSENSIKTVRLLSSNGFSLFEVKNIGDTLRPSFILKDFDPNVRQENVLFFRPTDRSKILDIFKKLVQNS
jgi:FkbM family methyltransferase